MDQQIGGETEMPNLAVAPKAETQLDAKHWAIRMNIKAVHDMLRELADDLLSGEERRVYDVGVKALAQTKTIIKQLNDLAYVVHQANKDR
jgi:hypothetical protein